MISSTVLKRFDRRNSSKKLFNFRFKFICEKINFETKKQKYGKSFIKKRMTQLMLITGKGGYP